MRLPRPPPMHWLPWRGRNRARPSRMPSLLGRTSWDQLLLHKDMSFTMTRNATETFTLISAKYLASKVTSDMRRSSQLHGQPLESEINDYGTELALLLNAGYI